MTTTLDKLDTINDSLNDIKTAVIAKGQTPTGDITTYATAISNIVQSAPVISSLSITPTTSQQTITAPSGTDGYSPITVSAVTSSIDNNIIASNIVSGVSILGVNGSAVELNGETRSVSITSTAGNTFTPSSGKNAITSITVTPTNEARTVNPSTSSQSLTVNSGYSGNGTITVNPVTASIDANITAENIKKDVAILGVIGSYEGSGGGGGKYQLLDRVKDDNNVEIGTISGFFTDENNTEYAVVCLDAQYRLSAGYWCSNSSKTVTNLPTYSDQTLYSATETATFNTQKILDFCTAQSATSTACTHCRSKSFVINGTTYYGQLPNIVELIDIFRRRVGINSADISASSYSNLIIKTNVEVWSSTQRSSSYGLYVNHNGGITGDSKSYGTPIVPILEIPNN